MEVLQVCAFGAPNAGNFMASLVALEAELKKREYETIYAFADTAKDKPWCQELCKTHKVYFLPVAKARILPQTYSILRKIYAENDITIVHSHFELYDIPVTVTAPKRVKVFWHLHDPLPQKLTGLHGILTKIQYGIVGEKARLLSVSEHYRQQVVELGFPEDQTTTILNGISLSRIRQIDSQDNKTYTFLTFGWDYYRKGTDIILKVCDKLYSDGYEFKLLLNGNDKTWPYVKEYYNGEIPLYVECGNPVEDINNLYTNTLAFVQASRRETFSYAVCEAAYAGLPVICSDINGLEWAHDIPSVHFFENENANELYTCMKQVIDESWLLTTHEKSESRKMIEKNFSLSVWCEKVIAEYFAE